MKRIVTMAVMLMGMTICPCVYAWSSLGSDGGSVSFLKTQCDSQLGLNERVFDELADSVDCLNMNTVAGAVMQAGIGQLLPAKYQNMMADGRLDLLVSAGAVPSLGVAIRF